MIGSATTTSGSSCALCSAQFDRYYEPEDPTSRLSWRQEIRAITTAAHDGKPRVSSKGYIRVPSILVSIDDRDAEYTGPGFRAGAATDLLGPWYRSASAGRRTFLLHEFCWRLLLNQVLVASHHRKDSRREENEEWVAYYLYHALSCVPRTAGGARIMADHIDRQSLGLDDGGEASSSPDRLRRRLCGDPRQELAPLGQAAFTRKNPRAPADRYHYVPRQAHLVTDSLRRLPVEILHAVLDLLPTSSVHSARLASPAVAWVARPDHLPRAFWAGRFGVEPDLRFAFAHEPEMAAAGGRRDWRDAYGAYRRALMRDASDGGSGGEKGADDGCEGVWSRRRIYEAVAPWAVTLRTLMYASAGGGGRVYDRHHKTRERNGQGTACPLLPRDQHTPPFEEIRYGSTPFGSARLVLNKRDVADETVAVAVSTVSWSSETYISGLRVLTLEVAGKGQGVVSEAGLVLPPTEETFPLAKDDTVLGVEVTMSLSGIRGLRFIINSAGAERVVSAGNTHVDDCSTSVIRLRAARSPIEALDLDFDIFKLIGIHLVDAKPAKDKAIARPRCYGALASLPKVATVGSEDSFMPGLHWSPRAPPRQRNLQTFITPCLRRPECFKQHLYMPLYGRERKVLCSVTALTDRDVGFRGFAYGYGGEDGNDDDDEEVYGYASRVDRNGRVRVCKRNTFVLASEKGEVITAVEVILWRIPPDATSPGPEDGAEKQESFRHTWRLEIKVTTNLGRQHTWSDGKKHLAGMEMSTQTFRGCSAEGGSPVAVAFLAAFDVPGGGGFDRFGVQFADSPPVEK